MDIPDDGEELGRVVWGPEGSGMSLSFNYVANLSVYLQTKDVTSHALLRKFLKIQILVAEGFKHIACLHHHHHTGSHYS